MHADHIQTRGMGGGKRDDRIDNLRTMHRHCHLFERHANRPGGDHKFSAECA
ncbi:MAG: HNH endonuclease [Euryarchaeota archaeon]|nr:HNH endonuclease [Euryarchaeota archaeon]